MLQNRFGVRLGQRILLAALFLGCMSPFAGAQGISGFGGSGGSSGGGLNSTGGGAGGGSSSNSSTGTTGSIGTSTPIGSGPISAFTNNSNGLSSLANTSGAGKGGSSSTNAIPVSSDPFSPFYVSPTAAGTIGSTTNPVFGQAIYPATTMPTATSTIQTFKASTGAGFNTIGTRRSPPYVTGVSDDLPLVRHNPGVLRNELQQVIARSSSLKSKDSIRVEILDGAIARLTGTVANAHDQRLAEGLIRMTPGVQNVVNNLEVVQTR